MKTDVLLLHLPSTQDGNTCRLNESRCVQSLQVTKQLVLQADLVWPCFSRDSIVEWAVLEQVLTGCWGCVARTVIHLTALWSGQS